MKMHQGHHGANHPVKDLTTGKVEITSMNHGFAVDRDSLPAGVDPDPHVAVRRLELRARVDGKPVFSVQYHPEASPGPRDTRYLFQRFVGMMERSGRADFPFQHAGTKGNFCRQVIPQRTPLSCTISPIAGADPQRIADLPVVHYRHTIGARQRPAGDAIPRQCSPRTAGSPTGATSEIYNYHHYHSTAHEVLGIAAGYARVRLGGISGDDVELKPGDVVVLPAGTGHSG